MGLIKQAKTRTKVKYKFRNYPGKGSHNLNKYMAKERLSYKNKCNTYLYKVIY